MPIKTIKSPNLQTKLFETPMIGEILESDEKPYYKKYRQDDNFLFEGNSIEWLKSLNDETVDLIFADPPYNIKKADWDKFSSQEEYIEWSME